MSEAKRPLKVFLCHAHADREPVRALYSRLVKDGVDAWFDKEKLLPGQDWELEIRKAVREADVVVVCLSKQFNQAGFRQKEVRLALDTAMEKPEGDIFIIPARLEECDSLESLRKWHWVDLFEANGYDRLMRALQARGEKIGAYVKKGWLPGISSPRPIVTAPAIPQKPAAATHAPTPTDGPIVPETLDFKQWSGRIGVSMLGLAFVLAVAFLLWKSTGMTGSPTPTREVVTQGAVVNPVSVETYDPVTPTSIPLGAILLREDFFGGPAKEWDASSAWSVETGPDGSSYWTADSSDYFYAWYMPSVAWSDYAFESRVQLFKGSRLSLCLRADKGRAYYAAVLEQNEITQRQYVSDFSSNTRDFHANNSQSLTEGTWYTIRVEIRGDTMLTYVDDLLVLRDTLPTPLIRTQGGIGFIGIGRVKVDSIRVWSLK